MAAIFQKQRPGFSLGLQTAALLLLLLKQMVCLWLAIGGCAGSSGGKQVFNLFVLGNP